MATRKSSIPQLTHLDADGRPAMVDVSAKAVTARSATAECRVKFPATVAAQLRASGLRAGKGGIVETAVIAGTKRKAAETRAKDMLDLLGLADKARELPGVLSGGQRQRLAIARALANEPTMLLADEPTGALDTAGGHEVLELFKRLHGDGQTILMVTHNDEVAAAGDRIVRMRDGKVESDGVTAEAAPATV